MLKITEIHDPIVECCVCKKKSRKGELPIKGVTFWFGTKWTESGEVADRSKPHVTINACYTCIGMLENVNADIEVFRWLVK